MTGDAIDGRRLRSERSRQAVIEALLSLYDSGVVRPTVAQVAEASGVSERSVFRHFTDMEDLASAALARQVIDVLPWFADPSDEGTLAERADAIVVQRTSLQERMANLARAAAHHAASSPTVAGAIADRRALLRRQVEHQFTPELDPLDAAGRARLLAQLDLALSLEAIDYLRSPSGGDLDHAGLHDALLGTVRALVAAAHQPQET